MSLPVAAVGRGTHKGTNIAGDCADHTGSTWRVYIDGTNNGICFCWSTFGTLAGGASGQVFRLRYTGCPNYPYDNQWVAYLNGTFKDCERMVGSLADGVYAGGESAGAASQEIDIHYRLVKYLKSDGVTWAN